MSVKSILVHVGPDRRLGLPLEPIVRLAEDFGATLIGIGAGLPRPSVELGVTSFATATLIEDERQRIEADLNDAEALFRAKVAGANVAAEWRTIIGFPVAAIAEAADAADLIVARNNVGWMDRDVYQGIAPGDLLMAAGRPVLIVHPDCPRIATDTVLVAWKDTRESRRAIADALPFLKRSKTVILLHAPEGGDAPSSADARAFLVRHGINVQSETLPRASGAISDRILDFAERSHADLIVAGAYGHSRAREWILGGVTKALLDSSKIPCLLSH